MNIRRNTIKTLEEAGFQLYRHGADHDIYRNPVTKQQVSVPRHNFDEHTARFVLKEVGLK